MTLKFKRNIYLEKLDKVMGADYSSKTPGIAYLNPDGVARAWVLVAILSTPHLLWLLLRLKKHGWLLSFTILVLIPFVSNYLFIESTNSSLLVSGVAVINWAVFLFLLKSSHRTWREPDLNNTPGSDFR